MRSRILLAALCLALLLPAVARAQEEAQPITWIAFSKSKPHKGQEAVKMTLKWDQGIYDKLLENGQILSWGMVIPITHQPGDNWNVGLWATMSDWSKVGELEKGFVEAFRARTPEQTKEAMADFAATTEAGSHYDEIVRQVIFSPGGEDSPTPRYFYIGYYKAQPGKESDLTALYKEYGKPVVEKLKADKVISGYGMYVKELHGGGDWTHASWWALPDMTALDKTIAAYAAAQQARTEEENKKLNERFQELMVPETHRDQILMIVHLGGQPKEE